MATERRLWFDLWVHLDGTQIWQLPPDLALDVGDCEGILTTIEYAAVGPGATGVVGTGVSWKLRRSAEPTADDTAYEDMDPTAFAPARTAGKRNAAYGADGAPGAKYPRGYLSVQFTNAAALGTWVALHVRGWIAIQGQR